MTNPFLNINEIKIEKEFYENGYVVLNDDDSNKNLIYLKNFILKHLSIYQYNSIFLIEIKRQLRNLFAKVSIKKNISIS